MKGKRKNHTAEYYDLLNEQNENSKIVMHDTKKAFKRH